MLKLPADKEAKATDHSLMKTRIRSLLTLVCAVSAGLLFVNSPAHADYIVTLQQVGPNVVAIGSGAIDLTNLTFKGSFPGPAGIEPDQAFLGFPFSPQVSRYIGVSGPTSFGAGSLFTNASSSSGDSVDIWGGLAAVQVPVNYVSNTLLSDSATWDNATFSSLGVTPGTYEWTWGTGLGNQNFTVQIGSATGVADSGSTFGLFVVALIGLFGAIRLRSLRLA